MKALLLEPDRQKISEFGYSSYKDIQRAVNSSVFEVIYRHIGSGDSTLYAIYIDGIGKFRTPDILSAINGDDASTLVGNLLIARTDEYGNDIDLTDDDIELIKRYVTTVHNFDRGFDTLALFPIYYPTKRH